MSVAEGINQQRAKPIKAGLLATLVSLSFIPMSSVADTGDLLNTFVSNGTASVVLLNHGKTTEKYFRDTKNDIDGMERQYEWGQSVGLFLRSGKVPMFDDAVKFSANIGYSHMFKLAASYPGDVHNWNYGEKIFISEECYWSGKEPGQGQYKCNEASGYGKLPVANVQLNWGVNRSQSGFAIIGDGFFNSGMITSATDDDALLSSYRGIMAQQSYNGYIFDGAYVIGFMGGNEDSMGDLSGGSNYYNPNPLTYDSLYTFRIRKKFDEPGGYQIAYGEAKDYLRRFHTSAYYTLGLTPQTNLFMQAQYYYNHKAGDLWDEDVAKGQASYDKYASALSYEFRLNYDAWQLLYGFTKINAPRESSSGSFSYGFGNAKGYLKLPTSGNYHGFRRDGEEAMVVAAKYDFRDLGLQDMSFSYGYHWGKAPIKSKYTGDIEYGREEEHALTFGYAPRTGKLRGLTISLKQAFYRPDETLGQLQPGDISEKADKTATKLIASYMFQL